MIVRAQILAVNPVSGVSQKTGKPYSFTTLSFIDADATEPDLIKCNVESNDVHVVSSLIGKVGNISVNYARGNFKFLGIPK